MEEYKSKVYVQVDEKNRITRIEGGYTTPEDLTSWVQIDEGEGDRYNLCQSHYFPGGLYTEDGIPRYKLDDGRAMERTEEEIAADRVALPKPGPTEAQLLGREITALQLEQIAQGQWITELELNQMEGGTANA